MNAPHRWGTAPEFVGPRHELRERLLLDLFLSGKPGTRVLNAGAGQGTFTRLLEERGFDVVSSDVEPAALGVLRRSLAGEIVEADVTALPFADASFDAAVLGEVLEHVDDGAALHEIARILRPLGVLALSVPAGPEHFGPSDTWAGHLRRYARADLVRVCEEAGFVVERCLPWGFPVAALYHRHLYERHVERHGSAQPGRFRRPAFALLRAALQVDRLFVGVERGALGYLVLARR